MASPYSAPRSLSGVGEVIAVTARDRSRRGEWFPSEFDPYRNVS